MVLVFVYYCLNIRKPVKLISTLHLRSIFYVICLTTITGKLVAGDILWESGLSLYIKLDNQDKGTTQPNNHPVELDAETIDSSLRLLRIWDDKYYEEGNAERVFSINQTRLLGKHIAAGLKRARSNEDIVFVIVSMKKGGLGTSAPKYMGGRAFYVDDALNIIIGDYDRARDKAMEAAVGGSGLTEIKYHIATGRRGKASAFNKHMIEINGVTNAKVGSKLRKDWFILNLEKTKIVIRDEKETKRRSSKEYKQEKLFKDEAAKLAKERRDMRLEMARLRKEMGEKKDNTEITIEERLNKLQALMDKELISKEEYDKRRTEILNEI